MIALPRLGRRGDGQSRDGIAVAFLQERCVVGVQIEVAMEIDQPGTDILRAFSQAASLSLQRALRPLRPVR